MNNELVNKVLDCVEVKINLAGIGNILIDDVIEKSLDKIVADTTNPYDDQFKAMLWPMLEKEAKEIMAVKVAELEKLIADKIAAIKI
jgi:hypothetical protein